MTDPLHRLEGLAVELDASRDRLAPLDDALLPKIEFGIAAPGVVIAACIWFKQTPERLERLVRSLVKHGVDGAVFLDGPYRGLSDERLSDVVSYDTIMQVARDFSFPVWSYNGEIWPGEPQKRTASARCALELADHVIEGLELGDRRRHGTPWFMYIDSDEFMLSDIDWETVGVNGIGTVRIENYRGDERVAGGEGDEARMRRLYPNTPGILFGPTHYDLRDNDIPRTYMGWEEGLLNSDEPAFTIGHDIGEKVIESEYRQYNDRFRLESEGKVMRVAESYANGGTRLVIRMDIDQAEMAQWQPGFVAQFGPTYMGDSDSSYARCIEMIDVPDLGCVDLIFERVSPEAAAERQAENLVSEQSRQEGVSDALAKRMRKKARAWDRKVTKQKGLPR